MSRLKRWNGSNWEDASKRFKRYDGATWRDATVRRHNGNGNWEIVSQKDYVTTYAATWRASYNGYGAYSPRVRVAQWGDTLSHYALWYNTTVSQLEAWNSPIITNPHRIWSGQRYTVQRDPMRNRRNTTGALYQGEELVNRLQNNHGRQGSMIGFDDNKIRNDLAGAEILKVEVYLTCHWAKGDTVRAVIGTHNSASMPSAFQQKGYWLTSSDFKQDEGKWFEVNLGVGVELRNNTIKGITIYADNSDQIHVGSFNGGKNPKIRITYRK